MHILFLTQVLPYPLDAGPKVRAYFVLRQLAQAHKVTLVSFVRASDKPSALAHLRQFCTAIYTVPMVRSQWRDGYHLMRSLVSGVPFIIARDWVPAMANVLKKTIADAASGNDGAIDVIHTDQLWMAPYALQAQALATNGHAPATVLDQHNAVYMIPHRLMNEEQNPVKRALLYLEAKKLARYEVETCRRFDQVVWVTGEDHAAVQNQAAKSAAPVPNSAIIPICIDPEAEEPLGRKPGARRISFLGGLHYPPNASGICWFAAEVFPHILREVPDAILTVIGKQPPARLHQLGIPAANLDVTGYVDDPQPYLEETVAFIVPLQAGGGMRVKILDAWAWGLPVVSTTVGAEGIQVLAGENILIADSPSSFAQAVIDLLRTPWLGLSLAQAGRRWVEAHYNWWLIYSRWKHLYSAIGSELSGR